MISNQGEEWTVAHETKQARIMEGGLVLGGTLLGIAGCALSERLGICALGIPAALAFYGLAVVDAIKTRQRVKGLKPDDVLSKTVG
jgi:hypothetical protein